MRPSFDQYLGSRPFLYGRKLLKDMGVRGHYVNEYDVVGFLGYEVKEVDPVEYAQYEDVIGEIFDDTWAVSIRDRNLILLSNSIPPRQQRISLFHESGHDVIPYHLAHSFSVRGKDTDPMIHKAIEREAFHAGSEVMFPIKHFVDDSMGLPPAFASVGQLGDRYEGGFEATGIRYALTHQGRIAIVVIKENEPVNESNAILAQSLTNGQSMNGNRMLFNIPATPRRRLEPPAPLRVQYCCRSYRFPKFIKSGTEIGADNLIYQCWVDQRPKTGEIPASVFGSSEKFKYIAECRPINGRIFVLLWLPNRQPEFFKGVL